jgi:hypothetical protein
MLAQLISDRSSTILTRRYSLISRLASERAKFENWLQLELLAELQEAFPSLQIEKAYPDSQERCDFYHEESEEWLELKLCVTNYCSSFAKSFKPRPITDQIKSILQDVSKLRRLPSNAISSVLAIAYPLPENYSVHNEWNKHLNKIRESSYEVNQAFSMCLERNNQSCNLVGYSIQLKA